MSETMEFILGVAALICIFILTRKFQIWKIQRTYVVILRDLKKREALNPSSAIELPYAKAGFLRMGLRDYRPTALQHLVSNGIVGMTEQGAYYIKDRIAAERVTETNDR